MIRKNYYVSKNELVRHNGNQCYHHADFGLPANHLYTDSKQISCPILLVSTYKEMKFETQHVLAGNVWGLMQPGHAPRGLCRRKLVNFILNQFTAARA
jgi:hypothetical protein